MAQTQCAGYVVNSRKKAHGLLIDMAIPTDRYTSAKVIQMLSKYKDLESRLNECGEWKPQQYQWW